MCPLRFVLLGASAAVALCGVVFVTHNKSRRSRYHSQVKVCKQVLPRHIMTMQAQIVMLSGVSCVS